MPPTQPSPCSLASSLPRAGAVRPSMYICSASSKSSPFSTQASCSTRSSLCLLRGASALGASTSTSTRTSTVQKRHATLIKRPHRPYTFTQLLTLSDGSTFLHRTTSPLPVYRSNKDSRNSPLWNPSNASLANVEEDEAGRLRAFRRRFGRSWDADAVANTLGEGREVKLDADAAPIGEIGDKDADEQVGRRKEKDSHEVKSDSAWTAEQEDSLIDLIGSFGGDGPQQDASASGIAMQKRQNLDNVKIAKPAAKKKK